jgi:hypothetical protein
MAGEPIQGQSLTEEDTFWLEQWKDLFKGSIPAIHDAGKQVIAMLTTIQGIYLAAIAYSELMKKPEAIAGLEHLALAAPLVIWMVALFFALNIFRTKTYEIPLNAPQEIKKKLVEIAKSKQYNLTQTYWLIVIGLFVAVFNILFYFTMIL